MKDFANKSCDPSDRETCHAGPSSHAARRDSTGKSLRHRRGPARACYELVSRRKRNFPHVNAKPQSALLSPNAPSPPPPSNFSSLTKSSAALVRPRRIRPLLGRRWAEVVPLRQLRGPSRTAGSVRGEKAPRTAPNRASGYSGGPGLTGSEAESTQGGDELLDAVAHSPLLVSMIT